MTMKMPEKMQMQQRNNNVQVKFSTNIRESREKWLWECWPCPWFPDIRCAARSFVKASLLTYMTEVVVEKSMKMSQKK